MRLLRSLEIANEQRDVTLDDDGLCSWNKNELRLIWRRKSKKEKIIEPGVSSTIDRKK